MAQYDLYKFREQPLYVIADIHGGFETLKPNIEKNDFKDCIIVIAGDIGLGFRYEEFYDETFGKINEFLNTRNITLLLIRGNHDDPTYFNENKINLSNVKAIKDYSIISIFFKDDEEMTNLPKCNILCVGGATSIDRLYRKSKFVQRQQMYLLQFPWIMDMEEVNKHVLPSYWEDELPVYREDILDEIKNDGIMIEHVITHTCPKFCYPTNKNGILTWIHADEGLSDTIDEERHVMSLIYDKLIKDKHILLNWIYGHYHHHNQEIIQNVKFTALQNCDFKYDIFELLTN